MLGRVVNPLGQPIDGLGDIRTTHRRPHRVQGAPASIDRTPVCEPLQTGLLAIDAMIPIGRGQRELIIGDRKTGKTAIAIDAIINQRGKGIICIYVAIGQKASTVANIRETLSKHQALDYTVIVSATAADLRAAAVHRPHGGRRHRRVLHVQRPRRQAGECREPGRARARDLRRPVQAGRGVPSDVASRCAARRDARPTRATSSTCTRACSSAPASSPRSTAAVP